MTTTTLPPTARRGSPLRRVTIATIAVASAVLLASCGTTATATTALEDGEHFGFASEATGTTLVLDPADFLTGEEAIEAAVEDGEIPAGEQLPNDFYVRDVAPSPTELPLADSFVSELLDNQTVTHRPAIDAAELAALYAGDTDSTWLYDSLGHLPMVVTVVDGEVVRAVQHYLP